jgi:hypothetical protein
MKIVHTHTAALCVLGLVSAAPVLASQAGLNVVHAQPSSQAGLNVVHAQPSSQAGLNVVHAQPSSQAGLNVVHAQPSSQAGLNHVVSTASQSTSVAPSGVPTKARCEVDEMLGSVICD